MGNVRGLIFPLIVFGALGFVGCNYTQDKIQDLDMNQMDYQWISANVIGPNCVHCHSGPTPDGGIDLTTYANVTSPSMVVPFQPSASQLYNVVSSNPPLMPLGGALPAIEVQAIFAWINLGAPLNSGTIVPPPPPAIPQPTYAYLSQNVFTPYCVVCHNATTSKGQLDLSSYNAMMQASGVIIPNNPDTSELYLKLELGEMPPNPPAPSASQQQAIYDWINAGALGP